MVTQACKSNWIAVHYKMLTLSTKNSAKQIGGFLFLRRTACAVTLAIQVIDKNRIFCCNTSCYQSLAVTTRGSNHSVATNKKTTNNGALTRRQALDVNKKSILWLETLPMSQSYICKCYSLCLHHCNLVLQSYTCIGQIFLRCAILYSGFIYIHVWQLFQ